MRVFLDDARLCPEGWVWARNYEEVIQLLLTGEVTEISLDHDLGMTLSGTVEVDDWDRAVLEARYIVAKSGYDVATWIEEAVHFGKIPVPKMTCHSANPAGRKRIEMVIQAIERRRKAP